MINDNNNSAAPNFEIPIKLQVAPVAMNILSQKDLSIPNISDIRRPSICTTDNSVLDDIINKQPIEPKLSNTKENINTKPITEETKESLLNLIMVLCYNI